MDCPRCEGRLERYQEGEREAVVCSACGFLDVPANHRYQLEDLESWESALERFYRS
jgi:DNA-directed RNA polymerase subunit M/transcription elongation factor TFIIS